MKIEFASYALRRHVKFTTILLWIPDTRGDKSAMCSYVAQTLSEIVISQGKVWGTLQRPFDICQDFIRVLIKVTLFFRGLSTCWKILALATLNFVWIILLTRIDQKGTRCQHGMKWMQTLLQSSRKNLFGMRLCSNNLTRRIVSFCVLAANHTPFLVVSRVNFIFTNKFNLV